MEKVMTHHLPLSTTIKLWLPVMIWCLVIFTFSAMPTLPAADIIWWDFIIKKAAHMIEYGTLFTLTFRAVNRSYGYKQTQRKTVIGIVIFCVLYALSDEYHQSFTPGRTATFRDVGFDTAGVLTAFLLTKRPQMIAIKKFIFAQ